MPFHSIPWSFHWIVIIIIIIIIISHNHYILNLIHNDIKKYYYIISFHIKQMVGWRTSLLLAKSNHSFTDIWPILHIISYKEIGGWRTSSSSSNQNQMNYFVIFFFFNCIFVSNVYLSNVSNVFHLPNYCQMNYCHLNYYWNKFRITKINYNPCFFDFFSHSSPIYNHQSPIQYTHTHSKRSNDHNNPQMLI